MKMSENEGGRHNLCGIDQLRRSQYQIYKNQKYVLKPKPKEQYWQITTEPINSVGLRNPKSEKDGSTTTWNETENWLAFFKGLVKGYELLMSSLQ